MPTEYVSCILSTGFFDGEFYATVGASSAIVNRADVKVEREPDDQNDGSGKLCVYVIDRQENRVLVEIPGQAVVGGLRTWVQE